MTRRTFVASTNKADYFLLAAILALTIFGVIAVYDASLVYAHNVFGGEYHFLLLQLGWVGLGLVAMTVVSKISYWRWQKIATPFFFLSLLGLFFVLLPTIFSPVLYGARRWLILNPKPLPVLPIVGRLSLQPSELMKIAWILFLAALLTKKEEKRKGDKIKAVLLFLLLILGLVIKQPDFGTAMILASIGLGIYFLSGASLLPFLFSLGVFGVLGFSLIMTSPYRRQRLLTYLNPSGSDPVGSGYHLRQVLISIGSGGVWGLGLGQSRQKYGYLPEVTGDSIFAIICEETGFVGGIVLIVAYLFLIWRLFRVVSRAKEPLGRLVAGGVAMWFSSQAVINLASMVALIPLTGVPLPLVSYGGSSLVFSLVALGIVLNISREADA